MSRIISLLRRVWLPLFLLSALSWLFAPAYYHDHFSTLRLISSYETGSLPYSWLFRFGDILSGVLLMVAPWLFGLWRRDKRLSWAVVAVGVLSAIDGIFADICDGNRLTCQGWGVVSSNIHDVESVLLVVLVVIVALYHARRYRRWMSGLFVLAQLAIALIDSSGLVSKQGIIVSQYAYELLSISWLAWLVGSFTLSTERVNNQRVRLVFGLWTLVSGLLAIIIALTHRVPHGHLLDVSLVHGSTLVSQHGVIAGVLMLYIARHIYQGQRRAVLLLLALFGLEIINYSVVTPSSVMLLLNLVSFTLLLQNYRVFDRNTVPLPLTNRLKDTAVILLGVVFAVLFSVVLVSVTGHGALLRDGINEGYREPLHLAHSHRLRIDDEDRHRVRVVEATIAISTLGLVAWSLFRPARLVSYHGLSDRKRVRELLLQHSTSTEDFFKLWPEDKNYYFAAAGDGFVAYRVVGTIAFALADPIASAKRQQPLLVEFKNFCRQHGWAACFLLVPEQSKSLYAPYLKLIRIGSSAVIDVTAFTDQTSREKWWRWQRNRGVKAGLQYSMTLPPHSSALLTELQSLSGSWLSDGEHKEQGFALGYFNNSYLQRCRLHLVRASGGELVAFANEIPVYSEVSQRTVDLIRYKPGENGTMPFLLMQLIQQLHTEAVCRTFDLGFVPFAGSDSNLLRVLRRLAAGRFSSLGLEQFKNKFNPDWQTNYIAYEGDLLDLARIASSLDAALKKPD